MQSIFLSQHFDEPDRDLVDTVATVIESHGLRVVRGDALAGGPVTPGVAQKIRASDACIGLATPATAAGDGTWTTHSWVLDELNIAYGANKRCIAIADKSVGIRGAQSGLERIDYDPAKPLRAIRKLAMTLAQWRADAGRRVQAMVLPDAIASVIGKQADAAKAKFRLRDGNGQPTNWEPATVVRAQGGPVIYLTGVKDDALIEVEVSIGSQRWCSPAAPPFPHFKLEESV